MKRHFPDFLTAYCEYAADGFVPPQFDKWAGISVIAGALERKVWLPWTPTFSYYPNLFILLVGLPGTGKSTSLMRAVNLLEQLYAEDRICLIPSQVTEAKFIELLGEKRPFEIGSRIVYQCGGYYFASEASNALKEIYGDLTASMTEFYDCPKLWEKATKKDGRLTLENVHFNLLAGSTFDFLGKLITTDNILGGFASRLTYVVSKEEVVRKQKFRYGMDVENTAKAEMRAKLLDDLRQINSLCGPFRAEKEFGDAWEVWDAEFQARRIAMKSEKMKSLVVRTGTTVYKLCMILAASESNELVLRKKHLDEAIALAYENERTLPSVFRTAKASDTKSPEGIKSAVFLELEGNPAKTEAELRRSLLMRNFDPAMIDTMLAGWGKANSLKTIVDGSSGKTRLELLLDPDENL